MALPWTFYYPVLFKSNIYSISATRMSGSGSYSEIMQSVTLSYLTWFDRDSNDRTGGGDVINFVLIGR